MRKWFFSDGKCTRRIQLPKYVTKNICLLEETYESNICIYRGLKIKKFYVVLFRKITFLHRSY